MVEREGIYVNEEFVPSADDEYRFGKKNAHLILIVCSLLYMVNYMDRQVLAVVQEAIKVDLGLTDTQIGIIQTVFLMGMALFSLPVAYLVDRWSRKKAIGIMAILWSGFTFLTGLGRSFTGILIPRLMVGIGEAGFTSGGTPLITTAYPNRLRGTVLGIFNIVVPLGAAMGVVTGGYLSVHCGGWRTPFYVFAVPGMVLGVSAFFLSDYRTVKSVDIDGKGKSFFQYASSLFRIPSLKWLYLGYAMMQIMTLSFFVWGASFMIRAQNIREDKAGLLLGLVGLVAIIGAIGGGLISDRWQRRNKRARMLYPSIAVPLAAVLYIIAVILDFDGIGYVLAMLFGIVAVSAAPPLTSVTQDVVAPDSRGISWGMNVLTQYALGGGWAPLLVGLISDKLGGGADGLRIAMIIAGCGGFLAGVMFFISSRYYPDDCEKVKDRVVETE